MLSFDVLSFAKIDVQEDVWRHFQCVFSESRRLVRWPTLLYSAKKDLTQVGCGISVVVLDVAVSSSPDTIYGNESVGDDGVVMLNQ